MELFEIPSDIPEQSRIRGGYAEGWANRFGAGPKYPPNLSLYSLEMIGAWKDAAPGMSKRLQGAGEAMKNFDFSTMTTTPYPAGAGANNSRSLSQTISGSTIIINGAIDPQGTAAIIQRHEARRGQDAMRYAASVMA